MLLSNFLFTYWLKERLTALLRRLEFAIEAIKETK